MTEKMKNALLASNLGFGSLGNGITVYDRTREENGDYICVAHISIDRVVSYRKHRLSAEQREAIESFAKNQDPDSDASRGVKVFNTRPQYPIGMKQVDIKFEDGSEYIIRPDGLGDTIMGSIAHDIMFKMMKAHDYKEASMKEKILFIANLR